MNLPSPGTQGPEEEEGGVLLTRFRLCAGDGERKGGGERCAGERYRTGGEGDLLGQTGEPLGRLWPSIG